MKAAFYSVIIAIVTSVTLPVITEDAYSHTWPVIAYPQTYHMQPGQTLTQDMRICMMTGEEFEVSSITFGGNYSTWARVEEDLPVRAAAATVGASSIDIPVTVTVPANFTEKRALIEASVEVPTVANDSHFQTTIPVSMMDNTSTNRGLVDCNFFRDIRTSVSYGIIVVILVGGALIALGYFAYRRSKKKSTENKASLAAKVFFILFTIIGSLLLLAGLFVLGVQGITILS